MSLVILPGKSTVLTQEATLKIILATLNIAVFRAADIFLFYLHGSEIPAFVHFFYVDFLLKKSSIFSVSKPSCLLL